ncbi:MAG: HAD family hydrolase [Vulcanimicrobiota bacterium]
MPEPRLILFDIDCTLLRTGGSGMVALSQALARVLDQPFQLSQVPPSGQTDPNIVRAMFREAGLPLTRWEECERQIFEIYPELLAAQLLERRLDSRLEPGIEALVELLHHHPELHLGVLTGNLEVTARMKLDVFGLNPYFPIGAFGSDYADRNLLGPLALERARRHYGCDFQAERTWFVGDTHHDILAARACGARVLAVATGSYSRQKLLEHLPDHCLEHLLEVERVLELLLAC